VAATRLYRPVTAEVKQYTWFVLGDNKPANEY